MAKLTIQQIYQLARDAGLSPTQAALATAIALGESGGSTTAVGDENLQNEKWGPSVGLWQVRSLNAETGRGTTRDVQRLSDPEFNAKSMYAISNGGTNWNPWTVYTKGIYRQHLDDVYSALGGAPPTGDVPGGALPPGASTPPRSGFGDRLSGVVDVLNPFNGLKDAIVSLTFKTAFAGLGLTLIAIGGWRLVQPSVKKVQAVGADVASMTPGH